jgi:formylglycine-generating enzyme required for sulfatase activity
MSDRMKTPGPQPFAPPSIWTIYALASALLGLAGCLGTGERSSDRHHSVSPALDAFDVELSGSTATLHMVPIPPGEVLITDAAAPGGHRSVKVGPFWISQTEVTWDLFDVYVYRLDEMDLDKPADADAVTRPSKPYLPPDRGFGHAGYPAISIAHQSAEQFCVWLSSKTGRSFRLATEAEWQHACKGYPIADEMPVDALAWHAGNAEGKTHPVGQKLANSFGLYDMLGNVAEWTEGLDGKPVTRGGSFADAPQTLSWEARASYSRAWQARDPQIPKSKWWLSDGPFVGFRVVCDPATPIGP